jgi:hypothetical protein
LIYTVAFDLAKLADDAESRPAHQPEHHGGSGGRFSKAVVPDNAKCLSSIDVDVGYWDGIRMSLEFHGVSEKDLAMDWVLQQKTSSDVSFQARDDRPVPLQQPNAEH